MAQPEHTIHLFYECSLAQQIWNRVIDIVNSQIIEEDVTATPIIINSDMIMFNHMPRTIHGEQKDALVQIIMTIKHRLYQMKFRDDIQRQPTVRRMTLHTVLDLEKVILINNYNGICTSFIESVNQKIKRTIGLDD